jgi:hypothetical protein
MVLALVMIGIDEIVRKILVYPAKKLREHTGRIRESSVRIK